MSQQGPGKRAGARRRGKPKKTRIDPAILLLALSITVLVVAWGYLVKAAIDFGSSGRDGDGGAWLFMALACVGAASCLFIGLILVGKLLGLIGIVPEAEASPPESPATPWPRSADAPRVEPPTATTALRNFAPPEPRTTEQAPDQAPEEPDGYPTGSHAAILPEGETRRLPNPRYPGGKRAAR